MKKLLNFKHIIIGIMIGACLVAAWGLKNVVHAESEVNEIVNIPEIYFKAVNPGYTVEEKSNVGEMIEIARREVGDEADNLTTLAGITVRYTTTSGREIVVMEFPENSFMAGESIILRLASSPDHELANVEYTTAQYFTQGLPVTGELLELVRDGEVLDRACWNGKNGCPKAFAQKNPTTLVRNLETGEFEHKTEYEVTYAVENYVVMGKGEEGGDGANGDEMNGGEAEAVKSQCKGLVFSEVLSYYAETQAEQFVEFYNTTAEQILLDGCLVKYKNKTYPLTGILKADGYVARYLTDFSITKNPNNSNTLELIDTDGAVLDKLEYPNGQRKGTAWAWIGYDGAGAELWRTTYAVTPGEPNVYQEYKTCEAGKVINEETGNCVKVTEVEEKVCAEGQYLNPLTGRCKKIEEEKATTECKEGYTLNPDTGRCAKIKENTGADYALETEVYEESSSFVALYAVLGVVGVAVIYVIYEFRAEIVKLWRKVWRRSR